MTEPQVKTFFKNTRVIRLHILESVSPQGARARGIRLAVNVKDRLSICDTLDASLNTSHSLNPDIAIEGILAAALRARRPGSILFD
jgi:hypothetical protein